MNKRPLMEAFLKQEIDEKWDFQSSLQELLRIMTE